MRALKIDKNLKQIIVNALKEDIGSGDITTQLLITSQEKHKAEIIFKKPGVLSGIDTAFFIFKQLGQSIEFEKIKNDGDEIDKDEVIARINGDISAILTGERVALNFLQIMSGIAGMTKQFVDKVKDLKVDILDTRKIVPGLRPFVKYAVLCGGGVNHRYNLSDQILIKENHLKAVDSSIKKSVDIIRKNKKDILIEVEVENNKQAFEALKAGVDIIYLIICPVKI